MDNLAVSDRKIEEGFIGQRMIVLPPDTRERILLNTLIQGLYLTAIGYYPHAVHHDRERKQGSQEYILLYCVKGRGYVEIGDKKLDLTPNSYIIIPPSKPHHYRSSIKEPWSIYWVHFTGPYASVLCKRNATNENPVVKPIPFNENRLKNFNHIMNILEDNFSDRNLEIINITILHFLSGFIYDSEIRPSGTNTITASIAFMKSQINKPLKIKELASQQNLSVSRYSELFKEKTGISPAKYFIQIKIQKSCQYLYFTDLSIKEICSKIGFDDPFYFSRIFKKTMGIPPSKYKKTYKS